MKKTGPTQNVIAAVQRHGINDPLEAQLIAQIVQEELDAQ